MSSLFLTAFLAPFLRYLPPLISAHFFVSLENNFFRDNLSCCTLILLQKKRKKEKEERKKTTYRCVTIDPTNVFSISPLPRLDYTAERRTRYSLVEKDTCVFDVLLGHRNVNNLCSRVFSFSLSPSRCRAKSSIEISIERRTFFNEEWLIILFPFSASLELLHSTSSERGGNP